MFFSSKKSEYCKKRGQGEKKKYWKWFNEIKWLWNSDCWNFVQISSDLAKFSGCVMAYSRDVRKIETSWSSYVEICREERLQFRCCVGGGPLKANDDLSKRQIKEGLKVGLVMFNSDRYSLWFPAVIPRKRWKIAWCVRSTSPSRLRRFDSIFYCNDIIICTREI